MNVQGNSSPGAKARSAHNQSLREAQLASHSAGVFPHFSSNTGLCMCLGGCCNGVNGCKCRQCPCNKNEGHTPEFVATQRAGKAARKSRWAAA